jgi:hypothetical protein
MLLLVSVIRHLNSITEYSAISVPLLRRVFLIKAPKNKEKEVHHKIRRERDWKKGIFFIKKDKKKPRGLGP